MIQHFVLTAFGYRTRHLKKKKVPDPLKPGNLEHRFKMFEISCLPSILGQERQDFTWILMVDPDLPDIYRSGLERLVSKRKSTYLVDFNSDISIDHLNWLRPWIRSDTQYVVTTKLDDDDALFSGFTKYIFDHLSMLQNKKQIPALLFFSCPNVVCWDFFWSAQARYGYQKPYDMGPYPPSTGFSVCCKFPELNFSIRGFKHNSFEYLNHEVASFHAQTPQVEKRVHQTRRMLKDFAESSPLAWDGVLNHNNYHRLEAPGLQAVIINHPANIRYKRLLSQPEMRMPVAGKSSFQGVDIDFERTSLYIRRCRKGMPLIIHMLVRHFKSVPDNLSRGMLQDFFFKIKDLRSILPGLLSMF